MFVLLIQFQDGMIIAIILCDIYQALQEYDGYSTQSVQVDMLIYRTADQQWTKYVFVYYISHYVSHTGRSIELYFIAWLDPYTKIHTLSQPITDIYRCLLHKFWTPKPFWSSARRHIQPHCFRCARQYISFSSTSAHSIMHSIMQGRSRSVWFFFEICTSTIYVWQNS